MSKPTLGIRGKITDTEIYLLQQEFSDEDFIIDKYETKCATISGFQEVVNIVFDDFHGIGFARDYVIGKIVEYAFGQIKKVIARLIQKNKVVREITILKEYKKSDGTVLFIVFHAESDDFDLFISEIKKKLSYDFFESITTGANINISLDYNKSLKVTILP